MCGYILWLCTNVHDTLCANGTFLIFEYSVDGDFGAHPKETKAHRYNIRIT